MCEGTLLLVDDEPLVIRVEQEILEGFGYHVVACSSPVEAREIFEDNPSRFNLVITDYAMPNMSGLELASSLKETSPDIPILLCTGYNQNIGENELKLFGVDQTLMKPFTARELGRVLQSMLDLKHQDDSNLAAS
jgi:CheY-like chemotaxis protein